MTQLSGPPFARYTTLVPEADVVAAMRDQREELLGLFGSLTAAQTDVLHPPYTWTIRQVLGHMLDTERVFGYRALRFARGDQTPLPGFDEGLFVANGGFGERPIASTLRELLALRDSHVELFGSLGPGAWARRGMAWELTWTVDDLARAIVGHARHHMAIVRKRLG